jgi:hypothetical protein
MKRFTILGLCAVVALAFSALLATGAQAKKSEKGELVLESKNGQSHLGTSKGNIVASDAEGGGHITTATSGTAETTFHGTESEIVGFAGVKCTNTGTAGEVKTEKLAEESGWIDKAKEEAGVDFKPASGLYLAKFECGALKVQVKDSVIGHVTPLNVMSADSKLDLIPNLTGTANSPEKFEGGSKDVLETEFSAFAGTEFESLQEQRNINVHNHGNLSVCKIKKGVEKCKPGQAEFNTVANPAQPEFGRCVKKKKTGAYSDANCATKVGTGGNFEFNPVPN